MPFVPGALVHLGRGDVVVVARAVEDIAALGQLEQAILLDHFRSALLPAVWHGTFSRFSCSCSLIGLKRWPEYTRIVVENLDQIFILSS
ncbi:hypothetical protein D3C77_611590 [compost metagenome]